MNRKYSPEMRERGLRMLAETRPSHPTMMSAVRLVAELLGMRPETLRLWQRRYEVEAPCVCWRLALFDSHQVTAVGATRGDLRSAPCR
jgi:hypothetical protein